MKNKNKNQVSILDVIRNLIRIPISIFTFPLASWWGSRKLRKWVKKNKREQDPNLYPFDERWELIRKKTKGILKRAGIKIEVEGIDNITKGGAWMVSNHVSNLDGLCLISALGGKVSLTPIAKIELSKRKLFKGYIDACDGFYLDRENIRQSLNILNAAAQYSKEYKRPILIFPEGKRSLGGELQEFKDGSFKFPQKYFLPIVPITLVGTREAGKVFSLRTRYVKVIIGKPIKAIEHSKLPTDILSKKVREIIKIELEKNINY